MNSNVTQGIPVFEDCYTVFKRMTPPSIEKQLRDAGKCPEDIWSLEYSLAQKRYRGFNNKHPIVVYFEDEYWFTYYES